MSELSPQDVAALLREADIIQRRCRRGEPDWVCLTPVSKAGREAMDLFDIDWSQYRIVGCSNCKLYTTGVNQKSFWKQRYNLLMAEGSPCDK